MKKVDSSVALTQKTREVLQAIGYSGERYEDTISRLIRHYQNCPFARTQQALRDLLKRMDSIEYPYPTAGETAEEYAERILSDLQGSSGCQIEGVPRLEGETDKDYLLRLTLMEVRKDV